MVRGILAAGEEAEQQGQRVRALVSAESPNVTPYPKASSGFPKMDVHREPESSLKVLLFSVLCSARTVARVPFRFRGRSVAP